MNRFPSHDDLTPEEAAAFMALPRETAGSDHLAEERAVRALRDAGLLAQRGQPKMRRALAIGSAMAAAALS